MCCELYSDLQVPHFPGLVPTKQTAFLLMTFVLFIKFFILSLIGEKENNEITFTLNQGYNQVIEVLGRITGKTRSDKRNNDEITNASVLNITLENFSSNNNNNYYYELVWLSFFHKVT